VQVFWVACVGTAIVASVLATWSGRARYVARVATGVLMLFGVTPLMPQIFLSLPRTMPASLTRHTSTG
jgi:hypothetical protein